jgi:hypothetical protein
MNISLSPARLFLCLLFIPLLAPVHAPGQRLHPRLKGAKPGDANQVISRVAIFPAQVWLVKDAMKGAEPMNKEAAAATPIIEKALAKALAARNLTVLDNPFTQEALENNQKLKYAVADLRFKYGELNDKIIKNRKDVEKARFTLGDQVLLLNQDDNIDAIVFVTVVGRRRSGGMKALGIITLNPSVMTSLYHINIGIVDARNGDVLAYTGVTTFSDIGKEDDKNLVDSLTRSLERLPTGKTTVKK